jgi:hypothetical protein
MMLVFHTDIKIINSARMLDLQTDLKIEDYFVISN